MEIISLPLPLFWLSLLVPPVIAMLMEFLRWRDEVQIRALAYISALFLAIPSFISFWYLYIKGYRVVYDPLFIDLKAQGFGSMGLLVDRLSAPIVFGVSLVTALVSIYSIKYMRHRIEELEREGVQAHSITVYYTFYLAFASSMLGVVMSTNMIELYVFLELSLISSFLLIAIYGYGDRVVVSLIYFVWTHVSSSLILLGVLYFGLNVGSFDIIDISTLSYVTAYSEVELKGLAMLVPILFVLGLLIKLAAFGVHVWLPYAHAEAPTPVSALLSPNMVGLAGYLLVRPGLLLLGGALETLSTILIAVAFISIVFGGLLALGENDTKRLLAYSSVSQMGYILLGITTLTDYGIAGAMLHYLTHAIGKAILFMIAGILIMELHGLRNIDRAGGLAKIYPITSSLAVYGFIHLIGMPPAMGLWSKLLIFFGLVKAYWESPTKLAAIAVIACLSFLVTVFYATSALSRLFFGELKEHWDHEEELDEPKASILVLALSGLLFFLFAILASGPLVEASHELLKAGGVMR
ncbi:MAG: complex I subunit 5 family protein [Acidilobaceae archaeon]